MLCQVCSWMVYTDVSHMSDSRLTSIVLVLSAGGTSWLVLHWAECCSGLPVQWRATTGWRQH